ncbi:DNA internalization-related competence protein ComEC/Rec2 [hydrothermal vent metagenome]|uniref:DNA internalization-related competence protein ComEC/Rec2 n=1 Tax=hydrothermal vent metagenome TaxID=652676 RepID=A0A3B0XN58_9ZZZZ
MSDHSDRNCAYSLTTLALSALSGVCLLQIQPCLQISIWTGTELLMLLPVCLLLFYYVPQRRVLFAFLLGYLWALLFAQAYLAQRLTDDFAGQELLLEGVVKGVVDRSERSVRFDFQVISSSVRQGAGSDKTLAVSAKLFKPSLVRLSWYYAQQSVQTGERWRLNVRLKPPHGMQNPGGFDYEKWLYLRGIHATGYVRQNKVNNKGDNGDDISTDNTRMAPSSSSMDGIRENLIQLILKLPDQRFQGLLQALTVGHKSSISAEQWQVLRNTGTSHLMAISGLHIGLIASLVFFLLRWIAPVQMLSRFSAQQVAAVFSLAAALFYALLAGFTVPTQRAFVMLLVVLLAMLFKRPAFSANTLALALLVVILINPVAVISAGFWLSFLAVVIISLVSSARLRYAHPAEPGSVYRRTKSRAGRWLEGVRIQWLIALGMLPLSVLLFQQGSLISPVANMLVIPLVGFLVVPVALLASAVSLVSVEAALWLFALASEGLVLIWQILQWLSEGPMASWKSASLPLSESALALMGVFLLLMPRGFPLRFTGIILLLPMLLYKVERPAQGGVWVTVLDVGQGLSVVLQTHEKTLLYDTGARFSERFDTGDKVILPYLQYTGVERLDMLFISHGDNDHAGGAGAILAQMDVQHVLAGEGAIRDIETGKARVSACHSGQAWRWDDVDFEVLHPTQNYVKANNRSCVLKVSGSNYSLLLTGDIEAKVEKRLLKSQLTGQLTGHEAGNLQVDVLVVPHHGSNTSSSETFLEAVQPQLAIVSAGYRNRFGHPTSKILKRYRTSGSEVLNTAYQGAIQVKFSKSEGDKRFKVSRQRKSDIHYWNHRL